MVERGRCWGEEDGDKEYSKWGGGLLPSVHGSLPLDLVRNPFEVCTGRVLWGEAAKYHYVDADFACCFKLVT